MSVDQVLPDAPAAADDSVYDDSWLDAADTQSEVASVDLTVGSPPGVSTEDWWNGLTAEQKEQHLAGWRAALRAKCGNDDLGNASRFASQHIHTARYAHGIGPLIWDGRRWKRDELGRWAELGKEVARSIASEVRLIRGEEGEALDKARTERLKWAARSHDWRRVQAMLAAAQSDPRIAIVPKQLDSHPWLLTVANGTIDLRTGDLRPHNHRDLITRLVDVTFDLNASHPTWDRFLADVTNGDQDLAAFLQRAVGYTLTGQTSEEVLFFLHGPTATGKSTFLEAIKTVLADYAATADFETFLTRRGDAGVRNDIARLAGARLVISNEVDDGKQLAEGLIKTLVGGDTITARYLYREQFEFRPVFKLWLAANHRPTLSATDDALWRRIYQLPFVHAVPVAQRDPAVKQQLTSDPDALAAILAWAVRGCLDWHRFGLDVPDSVKAYTAAYRAENDDLAAWLTDACELDANHWTTAAELRGSYLTWCTVNDNKPLDGGRPWGNALAAHGCTRSKRNRGHGWGGIAIRRDPTMTHSPI